MNQSIPPGSAVIWLVTNTATLYSNVRNIIIHKIMYGGMSQYLQILFVILTTFVLTSADDLLTHHAH